MKDINTQFLTTAPAARLPGIAGRTLILWADRGLVPVVRTATGIRLYTRGDIKALAERRGRMGATKRSGMKR